MKIIFKNIAALTYIALLLTGFFIPFNFSLAQQSNCLSPNVYTADGQCLPPATTPPSPAPYVLLAPLPCTQGDPGCEMVGGKWVLKSFDPASDVDGVSTQLGAYLNMMITVFIGLCAVLAVVMIVVGGLQYMTSELASSKEAGKERITNAVFGLLLALGAYAVLFTINPDLLKTDFAIPSQTVTVVFDEELEGGPPSLAQYAGALPSGPVPNCPTGVVKSAATGIVACGTISGKIDEMVAAARQANPPLTIWAGGFRTSDRQTQLRIQNCNGDITNAKAACRPPTARPGYSRHQSGLAVDLTCNGRTISTRDNECFIWLQNNALKYDLKNLPSEPWHWSVDGR